MPQSESTPIANYQKKDTADVVYLDSETVLETTGRAFSCDLLFKTRPRFDPAFLILVFGVPLSMLVTLLVLSVFFTIVGIVAIVMAFGFYVVLLSFLPYSIEVFGDRLVIRSLIKTRTISFYDVSEVYMDGSDYDFGGCKYATAKSGRIVVKRRQQKGDILFCPCKPDDCLAYINHALYPDKHVHPMNIYGSQASYRSYSSR